MSAAIFPTMSSRREKSSLQQPRKRRGKSKYVDFWYQVVTRPSGIHGYPPQNLDVPDSLTADIEQESAESTTLRKRQQTSVAAAG